MSSSSSSGMDLGFQNLEERVIIAERTTTRTNTQLPVLPSIIDIIGRDITIDDIQLAKQELINKGFDLKKDVNQNQTLPPFLLINDLPLIRFCSEGNLLIVQLLFLIGGDCTKLCHLMSPMYVAAAGCHLYLCKWLVEYGGDAKYQINNEANNGATPLRAAYIAWDRSIDKEGKTCRWLLRNGGGQRLSPKAMRALRTVGEKKEWNSNLLVIWMREYIQLHDTFIQFLCGATTTMITRKRKRKRERSLQILDGHPGIMELIGECLGLIRGKEIRMLQEFNELVIKYNNSEDEE
eukprot:CAMPEP_0170792294 /NCGR_PEP_ID=MMETSP0733-20121128/21788_1 /TAXON_ID=186038 /ORGANISM="Fragilariopsis kerguelensis, Strain L26-C5" /LENGTH=292 /DNA_ID=CAMNT_0011140655 /DNA_START=157 /DNA_END=1035 /DNA_ORIENTATION=+